MSHEPAQVIGARAQGVPEPRPESRSAARLGWAALGSGALMVLALARWLRPDPSGLGTHTQLGLPPCGFFWLTSLPCPACGLTTAFAHMARLELTSAVHAHLLGAPLFALTMISVPMSFWACLRAWPIVDTMMRLRAGKLAASVAVAALLCWVARIVATLWL
jgi:hypothetical protein